LFVLPIFKHLQIEWQLKFPDKNRNDLIQFITSLQATKDDELLDSMQEKMIDE